MLFPRVSLLTVVVIQVCVPKWSMLSPIPIATRSTNQNQSASQDGNKAMEMKTSIPPITIIGLKPNFFIGFSITGEAINTLIYNPVACKQFTDEETPFFSLIIASRVSSIPCENPDIDTSAMRIRKRYLEPTILSAPLQYKSLPNLILFCVKVNHRQINLF